MNGRHLTSLVFALADSLSLFVVLNTIAVLRGVTPWHTPIFTALILPWVIFAAAIFLIEGYESHTDYLSLDYASLHIIAIVISILVALFATFVFFPHGYSLNESRSVIVLGYLTLVPVTLGYRRIWELRIMPDRRQRTVIFVGDRATCADFQAEAQQQDPQQAVILCVVGAPPAGASPPLESFELVLARVESGQIDPEAIVLREANSHFTPALAEKLLGLFFRGVPIYTLELFHETYWRKIPRYRLNQVWLFQEGFQITREPVFEHTKRFSDLLLAGAALLLFAPVLLLAALAIWLQDRGPVFFVQTRIGRNRAPFRILKLRTMRVSSGGDLYTREGDDRITRVGRFLRASRIDEIPQLWNVLRGDMSLIGPRAEWDRLVERYEKEIPCYHFRHLVKPGITGWAQVNYPYGASTEDSMRKLEYDLYYIRHFSFILDATIVLKTIHVVLFGKGR